MPLWIFLFFLFAFPLVEAWSLVWLGGKIGWWTLAWVAAAFAMGLALIRVERLAFAPRMLFNLQQGHHPLRALLASTRLFLAGGLLMFPGLVTDVLAVALLLFPGTWRRPAARASGSSASDGAIEGEFRREQEAISERFPRGDT
jgi:UPF0716 protein FxsA